MWAYPRAPPLPSASATRLPDIALILRRHRRRRRHNRLCPHTTSRSSLRCADSAGPNRATYSPAQSRGCSRSPREWPTPASAGSTLSSGSGQKLFHVAGVDVETVGDIASITNSPPLLSIPRFRGMPELLLGGDAVTR